LLHVFFAVDCIGVIRHLPVTLYISPLGRPVDGTRERPPLLERTTTTFYRMRSL
jgi:hypothetical protein